MIGVLTRRASASWQRVWPTCLIDILHTKPSSLLLLAASRRSAGHRSRRPTLPSVDTVLFDLDDTLVDNSRLREARDARALGSRHGPVARSRGPAQALLTNSPRSCDPSVLRWGRYLIAGALRRGLLERFGISLRLRLRPPGRRSPPFGRKRKIKLEEQEPSVNRESWASMDARVTCGVH